MTNTTLETVSAGPVRDIPERERGHRFRGARRLSWQSVLAGIVTALAVQVVLGLFGVALGLGVVNAANPSAEASAGVFGVGSAMWEAVSFVVALFYGGFVAARLSGNTIHSDGILHGVIVWGATVLIAVCLLSSAIGGLFSGAKALTASNMKLASSPITSPFSPDPDNLTQQARDLINGEANTAGMTPDQIQADIAAQFVIITAEGDDVPAAHQRLVADLISQGIPPAVAQTRVADWQVKSDAAKQKARAAADKAAHAAAKAAVAGAVVLLLGAFTAGLGSSLGTLHAAESLTRHYDQHPFPHSNKQDKL